MDLETIAGPLGAGVLSSFLTFLGVRTTAKSSLEAEYMKRFDDAMKRSHEQDKRKDERIKALEERQDSHEKQTLDLLREEKESCEKKIDRLRKDFDERISSFSGLKALDDTL
jgi:uncharacterized protein (DUF2132 family)